MKVEKTGAYIFCTTVTKETEVGGQLLIFTGVAVDDSLSTCECGSIENGWGHITVSTKSASDNPPSRRLRSLSLIASEVGLLGSFKSMLSVI